MIFLLRILFCWVPVREHHLKKSEEFFCLRIKECGKGLVFKDLFWSRLVEIAYHRAQERGITPFVSAGKYILEADLLANEVVHYLELGITEDSDVKQIVDFFREV